MKVILMAWCESLTFYVEGAWKSISYYFKKGVCALAAAALRFCEFDFLEVVRLIWNLGYANKPLSFMVPARLYN